MASLTDAFHKSDRARELFRQVADLYRTASAEALKTMRVDVRNASTWAPSANEIRSRAEVMITGLPEVTAQVPILVGDIVSNLRAALDYLVGQLVELVSGAPPKQKTQFPIGNTAAEFNGQKWRLAGMSNAHETLIESLQPYNGHKWLCILQELSNADKHRNLVVLAVGIAIGVDNLSQPLHERTKLGWIVEIDGDDLNIVDSLSYIGEWVHHTLRRFEADFLKVTI